MDHQHQHQHTEDQTPKPKKRISDGEMYLPADEQVDVHNLINGNNPSYIFPRDDQLNYICVFQGCTKPILRGLDTDEYLTHLRAHVTLSDRLLSNMLRRVSAGEYEEDDVRKRRRANSTNTYHLNMLPKKTKEPPGSTFVKEEILPIESPESPESPPATPRKRAHSTDDYNIPLKPSSRGVQLRDQMLRYGLHLFRIDAEGKYICFFDECSLHMMTNFSRHIAKHEKNGDRIKQELLHLCSPAIIKQQLQAHPSLHPPLPHHLAHPSAPSGPLQQLLYRQQQETVQLQQQHQQQQQYALQTLPTPSPHQLEQMRAFHSLQFQQLQMQHKQQLQMLQQSISSPSFSSPSLSPSPSSPPSLLLPQQSSPMLSSPHLQISPSSPVPHAMMKQNMPELSLVQNETDLALMRTQISKIMEESSSRRPSSSPKPRSLSLAYSPTPSSLSLSPPSPSPHLSLSPTSPSPAYLAVTPQYSSFPPHDPPRKRTSSFEATPPPSSSSLSSSPSTPSSEIQWVFGKTKPVLSK